MVLTGSAQMPSNAEYLFICLISLYLWCSNILPVKKIFFLLGSLRILDTSLLSGVSSAFLPGCGLFFHSLNSSEGQKLCILMVSCLSVCCFMDGAFSFSYLRNRCLILGHKELF